MTIEESVKKDPAKFRATLETKESDIKKALEELSVKLDAIIGGAIREYCANEGVDWDVDSTTSYKAMNKQITGYLDELVAEHVNDKRKNL